MGSAANGIRVSVIVPVYRVPEPLLRRCVESLGAQTLHDIEIILVDDGSPDDCGRICDEYAAADPRIMVIHKPNGGLSAARNSGQDAASGECLMFVDGDDWVEPDCCEAAYRTLKEEDVQLVFFNNLTEYPNSSVPYRAFGEDDIHFDEQGCRELQERVLDFNGRMAQAHCRLIRRDFLAGHGIRHVDELKQGAEGIVFNVILFGRLQSAYYLARELYHYTYNEQSISHSPDEKNYYLILRCFEYIERFIRKSANRDALEARLLTRVLYAVCTTAVTGYFNPDNPDPRPKRISGMEHFMAEPLVRRAMSGASRRGMGTQRRIILSLLKWRQWRAVSMLGRMRRNQLRNR